MNRVNVYWYIIDEVDNHPAVFFIYEIDFSVLLFCPPPNVYITKIDSSVGQPV